MKKITLLIALFLISFASKAQVIASQNFDTALTWATTTTTSDQSTTINAWARATMGSAPTCAPYAGAGMAGFRSYSIPANGTGRLTSPAMTFAGATYRVKFKMYRDDGYPTDADNVKVYYNTTGGAGGTLLGTVNRSIALAPTVSANGWYSYAFDIPGTITGTGYIAFLGTSKYGNNIFIDEVSVEQIPVIDMELSTLTINAIQPNGAANLPIAGSIRNYGSTAVTAVDINWQVDNGAINTQTITGLNIAANQTYNYTHQATWSPAAGLYSLKVWVSNVNGGSGDSDANNNQIIRAVSVASNSTARLPLYEEFSSSTCGPCASFNGGYYNAFHDANAASYASIAYRVNWPGTGDPYYTTEVGTRVSYYGINGAPTLLIDSKDGTNFNSALLDADLATALSDPAYFVLSATKTLTDTNLAIDITTTPYLAGTYRVFAAVVEKTTYNNVASNGETEFHEVFMKMVPDAAGTTINCSLDTPVTTSLNVDLTGLFIEEMTDLDVVVFIQDYATKNVMQAAYATEALATPSFTQNNSIKLYPNPSTGIVRIKTTEETNVTITDVTGKVVYTSNQLVNEATMNLSNLQKGVYIAKMSNTQGSSVQKLVIK